MVSVRSVRGRWAVGIIRCPIMAHDGRSVPGPVTLAGPDHRSRNGREDRLTWAGHSSWCSALVTNSGGASGWDTDTLLTDSVVRSTRAKGPA
jgi:hypothetical protein